MINYSQIFSSMNFFLRSSLGVGHSGKKKGKRGFTVQLLFFWECCKPLLSGEITQCRYSGTSILELRIHRSGCIGIVNHTPTRRFPHKWTAVCVFLLKCHTCERKKLYIGMHRCVQTRQEVCLVGRRYSKLPMPDQFATYIKVLLYKVRERVFQKIIQVPLIF